jgi:hypothetical protein
MVFLGLLLGSGMLLSAQPGSSLYFMQGVPQSNRINPARHPACGAYIGIPTLAPLSAQLSSSSLGYGDIIYPHPSEDSLITFLHPDGDQEAFLNKLNSLNYVVSYLGTTLLSFGFNTNAGFFSVDVSSRLDGNVYFPGDLARLALEGADDGETYNMDGIGADISGMQEIGIGWSGAIGNNVQIGIRGKALFGLGNLSTVNSDFSLGTSDDAWTLESDMLIKASLPFARVSYDDEDMIDDIVIDEDLESMNPWALARQAFNAKNFGLGLDVGIDYRPSNRWLLSASILDIGYIRWTDEIHEISYINTFTYNSQELDPLDLAEDESFDEYIDSVFSQLGDTLLNGLEMSPGEVYSRRLNTKLYLGASWEVAPYFNLGLLSRTDFLKGSIVEQITASANLAAGRFLNFTLSYSYINSYFKNFGAGIAFNAGPINLYVISDNVLNVILWPEEAHLGNLWFGMNIVFGYKKCKKPDMDRPLVY